MNKIKVLIAILISLMCVGCNYKSSEINKIENSKDDLLENTDKLTNNESDEKILQIKEVILNLAGKYKDNIGVYYYNLITKEEYTLNGDIYFNAASLAKVAQAMEVLDLAQEGIVNIDEVLVYEESDYAEGTGILQQQEKIEPMTVLEAIELSIVYSDNIAYNMLKRNIGTDIRSYMIAVSGIDDIPMENRTTAYEQGQLYKKLYYNEENNLYYDFLIECLKNTVFNERIDKYIEVDTAHKIGNYYRYYNDAAIIYDEEPYILVVLTKDIGELAEGIYSNEDERNLIDWGKEANGLIALISHEIYKIVSEK